MFPPLSILLTPGVWVYHTPVVSFSGLKLGVLQFNSILFFFHGILFISDTTWS